jgi:hypothetical protein
MPGTKEWEDFPSKGACLAGYTETALREYVEQLMSYYVPSTWEDQAMVEITQGRAQAARKTNNFFSTCGELCHWVLERIGYRGPVLNRTINEPKCKKKWKDQLNIGRLYFTAMKKGVFVRSKPGITPNMGDLVFIYQALPKGKMKREHVLVFKEQFIKDGQLYWRSWDAGQGGRITQKSRICERKVKTGKYHTTLGGRRVAGWVNIALLDLTARANLHSPE